MSGEFTESLNLIDVKRESTGLYSCGARNSEGESRSSTLSLKVQCEYFSYSVDKLSETLSRLGHYYGMCVIPSA